MSVIRVKAVVRTNAEALSRFFRKNDSSANTRQFHPFPLTEETGRRIAGYLGKDRYFLAFMKGTVVGFGMLRGWDEGYDVPSFGVLVDFRCRRQHIGRRMLEFAVSEARRRGSRHLRLTVYDDNVEALGLYRKAGFIERSRENVSVYGEERVRLVMTKELSTE